MGRNGQIFYLLNRIEELDGLVSKIHKLCPAAKIGVIHGQMTKERIEDELVSFLDRKYDVLVCTTIIETGIDIPNANTLIIERADYLGLSQLYQIRGRVGRSDRISYAYLMYEPHKVLTQQAKERLDAIKEFTALGSGYKIAMKDLAIRGAGDILGDEQSGFIDAIGMDLYMKLLSEAINELKGIKEDPQEHKYFNISISKHIDPNYVLDDEIRIIIHKEISKIKSRDQIK
jgi:transcription-repair coupling factor (superfamily II helicase)